MVITIEERRNEGEGGSNGCLPSKQEQEEVITATKKFASSRALESFLYDPLMQKLYKVLHVDWTKNQVKVECIPLAPAPVVGVAT